jgi:hypothetical protein
MGSRAKERDAGRRVVNPASRQRMRKPFMEDVFRGIAYTVIYRVRIEDRENRRGCQRKKWLRSFHLVISETAYRKTMMWPEMSPPTKGE